MRFLFFILSCTALLSCEEHSKSAEAASKYSLNCPDGAYGEIDNAGAIGEDRKILSCKLRHGEFVKWKSGKKIIKGHFTYGKKTGLWEWYVDGKVTKTIEYVEGKEVNEVARENQQ